MKHKKIKRERRKKNLVIRGENVEKIYIEKRIEVCREKIRCRNKSRESI